MREKIKHIVLFVLATLSFHVVAQDIHFTQFSSNPIFLNPAYTGATYEHRFIFNYRNQWPGISKTYSTTAASYDYNMTDIKSGVGIQLLHDKAGTSALSTTGILGSYAYYYQVEKLKLIRMGLQLGYISRYYDNSNLVFNDQLYTGSSVSNDVEITPRVSYLIINAGALYTTQVLWGGFAFHNLNKPNTTLVDGSNKLPMRFSVHGGYRFIFEKKGYTLLKYFAPAFNYNHQHKFDQLDIGANYFYSPLSIGLWYRGIPVKHYKAGYSNSDALSILLGIDVKQDLRIAFSYDFTLSRLAYKSLGAPELSIIYEIAKKSKRKRAYVSCPKF